MKYSNFFILLLVLINSNCKVTSQDIIEINVHLNEEIGSKSRFIFKYEFGGKGENAVENTIFETYINITLMSSKNDTFYYSIESESKESSSQETLQDGEALILYSLFGTKMEVTCDQNGEIIDVINKDGIIDELTKNSKTKRWVEYARKENEALLFESIYKLNYEHLLKYTKIKKTLPYKMETDSIVLKSLENPESYSKTVEESNKSGNIFEFKKYTTINSKEFIQKEELYETIFKPSKSVISETLITDKKGLVKKLIIISETTREGIIMKSNGKISNETGIITENLKLTFERK